MKKLFFTLLLCLPVSIQSYAEQSAVSPASLSLYVFEESTPVEDFQVWMDQGVQLKSIKDGAALFTLKAGSHQLNINRPGFNEAQVNLNVVAGEYLQVIITQYLGNPVSHVALETSKTALASSKKENRKTEKVGGVPGTLQGRIVNSENGEPIKNARIFFSGLATDFVSDENGEFTAKVPAASYSISILHTQYATQTLDNILVSAKQTKKQSFEITPAGIALKEFVVVAPFIQGSVSSLVDERKQASVMSDFVGSEQMAKSGDSDAAAALTRVAGLTLIDGKYAVIRGMGDRYTQVLMNGAVMRSPDPSSKSVDLDMYPASILDSIEVQKTYSSDVPGAFGGGVIKLRTKAIPEDDFVKVAASLGGISGVTGQSVLSQDSGGTDFLGVDDGDRGVPSDLSNSQTLNHSLQTKQQTTTPDLGLSLAFGNRFNMWGMNAGYQSYLAYKSKWNEESGEKNSYAASGEQLTQRNDTNYVKSNFSVDITGLFTVGIEDENNSLKSTTSLIRKTSRLTRVDEGLDGENGELFAETTLQWSERQLFSQQFNGQHTLWDKLDLNWQYGLSTAKLTNPDTISYRYDDSESGDSGDLYYRDGETSRESLQVSDEGQTLGLDLAAMFEPTHNIKLNIKSGFSWDKTNRESQLTRYEYNWFSVGDVPTDIIKLPNPDDILNPGNMGPDGFILSETTTPADTYQAESQTTALYGLIETSFYERLDIVAGIRMENFTQTLDTFSALNGDPINVEQDTADTLPSLLATLKLSDHLQLRAAFAQTVNRPSMLEVSSGLWIDPQSGDQFVGNPRLVAASIDHLDMRLEYYGSGSNSISLAYFNKDFTDPIERTLEVSSGSDTVVTFQNAQSATNSGIELDWRWDLDFLSSVNYVFAVSGNYSVIESDVVLPENNTEYSDSRSMQGQSPYTANLMLTLDQDVWGIESALIFNEIGERITRVGQGDVPHVYEQPLSMLDLTLSKSFDDSKLSFKLKNILDEERLYTQGGEVYQKNKIGVGFSMDYSQSF